MLQGTTLWSGTLGEEIYSTGCIKKSNLGIYQEIDIVLKTKDFRRLGI
jgi:hypothetical protein